MHRRAGLSIGHIALLHHGIDDPVIRALHPLLHSAAQKGQGIGEHRFELEYALERGSTANSVLFEAGDGAPAVLVHPPGVAYSAAFLPVLAEALPSSDAPLLVVVGHVNPNRVALLQDLAEAYAGLELIVSNPGAKLIEELWSQRKPAPPGETSEQPPLPDLPPLRVIRQEQTLPLSHQRSLMLVPAGTSIKLR